MELLQKNKVTGGLIGIAIVALILFGITYTNNGVNNGKTEQTAAVSALQNDMNQDFPEVNSGNPIVTLKTNMGDITLELYMDRTPITAGNFIKLSEEGFYDSIKFHRVINNFMIQAGDPNTKGDDVNIYGRGGPDYTIEDEFHAELSNLRGTIAMANIGQPNSGGSQFFINLIPNVMLDFDKQPLTSKHPVFGHVLSGMDVVDAIAGVETVVPEDRPVEPVIIESVVIVRSESLNTEDAEPDTEDSVDAATSSNKEEKQEESETEEEAENETIEESKEQE